MTGGWRIQMITKTLTIKVTRTYIDQELGKAKSLLQDQQQEAEAREVITNLINLLQANKNS